MGESYSLAIVWCHFFGQRALVKADALSLFERGELNGVVVGITKNNMVICICHISNRVLMINVKFLSKKP